MTSNDTNKDIISLLEESDYFGMTKDQITILNQGLVPTVKHEDAKLVLHPGDDFNILTETHGHGDIHAMLHKHGVVKKWKETGIEWIFFLQVSNHEELAMSTGRFSVHRSHVCHSLPIGHQWFGFP